MIYKYLKEPSLESKATRVFLFGIIIKGSVKKYYIYSNENKHYEKDNSTFARGNITRAKRILTGKEIEVWLFIGERR